MIAMLNFAGLIAATMIAAAVAVACNWLMLRVAFHLMQPAAIRKTSVRTELVCGTAQLARAFAPNRRAS
jgi:hypothetical protein